MTSQLHDEVLVAYPLPVALRTRAQGRVYESTDFRHLGQSSEIGEIVITRQGQILDTWGELLQYTGSFTLSWQDIKFAGVAVGGWVTEMLFKEGPKGYVVGK